MSTNTGVLIILLLVTIKLVACMVFLLKKEHSEAFLRKFIVFMVSMLTLTFAVTVFMYSSEHSSKAPSGGLQQPAELQAPALPRPAILPTAPVPTAMPTKVPEVPTPVAKAEPENKFGGVLIKNPNGRTFTVSIFQPDSGKYEVYGEENSHDIEFPIPAEDTTPFKGIIMLDNGAHEFDYDPKVDFPKKEIPI